MSDDTTLDQLADEYVRLGDRRAELEAQAKDLKAQQDRIESRFVKIAEDIGVDKFSAGPLTVSVKEEAKYAYDPDHWDDLLRICIKSGYTNAVQRRCTSKVLQEMVESKVLPISYVKVTAIKKPNIRKVK